MPVHLCKIGKFFLTAMFGVIFLILPAHACTCPPNNSPKVEMKQADAVFSGKVVKTNAPNRRLRINLRFPFIHFIQWRTRIEFSVKEVWKGQASSEIGIINTLGSTCDFTFKEGDEYIVYAYGTREGFYTHRCSRTALLIDASEDLIDLGKGIRPELPSIQSSLPAIGSLLLALALPVLILWLYCLSRGGQQRE
jgi:hypothetical protein